MKRRKFIGRSAISLAGISIGSGLIKPHLFAMTKNITPKPIAIATWNFQNATKMAGKMLEDGASALDAVEQGVMVEESNLKNTTVGDGGAPDRDGNVTLDACIMAPNGNAGSVVYLKEIAHPVSVARKVMEETPHVMLAGEGALQFAIQQGFKRKNLLTAESEKAWKEWLEHKKYQPIINIENHDTIGMLCMDKNGDIAGACTTSGLSYKMNGRVGDSPIIGSGLFLDNEVGGAVGTGMGEAIMKSVGSFLIVELMRQGKSPQEACEEAVMRTVRKAPNYKDFQVAYVALNKQGEIGSYCIHKGFSYAKFHEGESSDNPSPSYLDS
ncbi:N(4)-(beta-N-acetylglucosaminyl)-L-asparaginase [Christiangramia sabulilitoris]|uniref:N(4)-(Beta-N-acetylglucosaminyl)-L-asparaginase n=1 Tax=Christiangramia sabulilitoris TaxID=2583991 RepID=A0A550I0E8_9FLAO|nr:N(4)-(beta-N-acetylglucosaminyl)-L-asparaginase [Christiangramia sabulilitoris]TRO64288.1 N(4)-(beta-N-acetylglucosaminyl)-L-asparaginase [Christiangramia sabulilitoris]